MKQYSILILILVVALCGCSVYKQDLQIQSCTENSKSSTYSKAGELIVILDEIAKSGVPGVSMAVYSEDQWFTASAGLAKIEGQVPMQSCNLQYLQSVAKTYMAVAILKLYEEGKIDLDAPMTKYLPEKFSQYITDGSKVTVRMMLNHTSGIPEYNFAPSYVARLLQHNEYAFKPEEYLENIKGKPLTFVPGTKYSYRNTNFLLLALMADAITGDHAKYISDHVFKPLGLTNTYYRAEPGYLNYPNLVNSYWDRNSTGMIENASQLERNNVIALIGDDGIVATPEDAIKFLKGLLEGKLISLQTLDLMKTWANDKNGNPTYGLGLDHKEYNGHVSWGHSGGGIGAGCQLYYFPKENVYYFIGINLGTVTESPIHKSVEEKLNKIYEVLLK